MLDLEKRSAGSRDGTDPAGGAVSKWTGPTREAAVQRMFTAIARVYDLNNSLLSFGLHHNWKRRAAALVPSLPKGRALDLGADTGDLALLIEKKMGDAGRVVAADLNEAMLRVGWRKIGRRRLAHRISCLQANAGRLGFRHESFDVVITGFCIRNVGHLMQTFLEVRRVLKPGGRFVCLEFSRPRQKWLAKLYDWYSFKLLPWIGTTVAKDSTGVYDYLPASIRTFPDQERLADLLREAGFQRVSYLNLTGGIVAIHSAVK